MPVKLKVLIGTVVILTLSCASQESLNRTEAESQPASGDRRSSELVQPENWFDALPRPGYASLEKVGEFQNWFEVYKLTEGTYAIYEPYQFQEVISYLVLGKDRGVLIDAGNGIGNMKQLVDELTDLPVSVLLTHAHIDHIGSAHLFDEVAIYNNREAIARIQAGVPHDRAAGSIDTESKYVWKPLPESVDPATFEIRGVNPTSTFEEGDIIDLGGRRLEVIFTPGHSPGSACFLDLDNRLLFTGDHFYPGPLYAHGSNVDLNQYAASNDKIAQRVAEYDYVLSAHNEPWVKAEIIPRVTEGFEAIIAGGGDYSEDGPLRRYRFDGFDIIVRAEAIEKAAAVTR
jgi:glyoxylase-like metal-dependent hydrolase (beta-lactamase superfamily II)